MPVGISVVICCYNSSSRISPTLNHLVNQKNIPFNCVEVILVDNGSTDNTAVKADAVWSGYTIDKPAFKIVQEPIPGLSAARKKGIEEAHFDFVLFCDDDNWLDENYLNYSLDILVNNAQIGALGGIGMPVFEGKEPPYFWKNQYHVLAVGPQWSTAGDITESRGVLYGAGMILNKSAFLNLQTNYNFQFLVSDRTKNSLTSSGDHELCLALRLTGYKIYYSPNLQFRHFITENRTTIKYYKKLFYGFGVAYAQLHVYRISRNKIYDFKNDYRYICLRCLKNILKFSIILLLKGYYFNIDKYKFLDHLQSLCTNRGIFITSLRVKNVYKVQFLKSLIFHSKT